jgi:hypothetical protein
MQTPHNRSREKATPTHKIRDKAKIATLKIASPSHNIGRVMIIRRRTQESGVNTIKSLSTTPKNVTPSSHSWSSRKLLIQRQILTLNQIHKEGSGLLMMNPTPLFLPPKSIQANQKNQRKGNTSFTHICG